MISVFNVERSTNYFDTALTHGLAYSDLLKCYIHFKSYFHKYSILNI